MRIALTRFFSRSLDINVFLWANDRLHTFLLSTVGYIAASVEAPMDFM